MALEPYSPCPCGSGKKFKWCCQPIHVQIDKAFRQESEGQHEAALRSMDELVAQHPDNPEAWGRKAQLLYLNSRVEDAENALQKAFDLNPNYPFGHLLRGMFRQNEGELVGALALFRKAAELYDVEASDQLGQLYAMIGECELKMNRPIAARAAIKMSLRLQPSNQELRQAFDEVFSTRSSFPESARKDHVFQSPAAAAPAEQRAAWDKALAGAATGKLSDAVRAFDQLVQATPEDAAAWFNLALVRAWLGDNKAALEALDRSVALDADETRAVASGTLAEVLRLGHGMEDQSDFVEHSYIYQMRDPQVVVSALQYWDKNHRLIILDSRQEEGIVSALVLEAYAPLVADPGRAYYPRLGAYLLLIRDHLRIWNTNRDALEKVRTELMQQAGQALVQMRQDRHGANFPDVLSGALSFPVGVSDKDEAERGVREHVQKYFEDIWIHHPLRSLGGVAPVDAAGHANLRRKVLGVIQFLQECATVGGRPYDFDRLRRKLGLLAAVPESTSAGPDIAGMGAAELSALPPDSLAEEHLEQAYQAALKLDARDLAGRFARLLVSRPPRADQPDRYPWHAHLIQLSLTEGDTDAALNHLNEGEKDDCEHNEGRRRNDYELRRGQIHAKRGEADAAQQVFERLIERAPTELRYRGSAAEAMLSARQGGKALRFAEQGLAEARKKNDRDSEGYFMELVEAARRQS
jgi:tetratricopeptide (TPR) repeat protein